MEHASIAELVDAPQHHEVLQQLRYLAERCLVSERELANTADVLTRERQQAAKALADAGRLRGRLEERCLSCERELAKTADALTREQQKVVEVSADADHLRMELERERSSAAEAAARAMISGIEADARYEADTQELKCRLQEAEQRMQLLEGHGEHSAEMHASFAKAHPEVQFAMFAKLLVDSSASREELRNQSELLQIAATENQQLRERNEVLEMKQNTCLVCQDRVAATSNKCDKRVTGNATVALPQLQVDMQEESVGGDGKSGTGFSAQPDTSLGTVTHDGHINPGLTPLRPNSDLGHYISSVGTNSVSAGSDVVAHTNLELARRAGMTDDGLVLAKPRPHSELGHYRSSVGTKQRIEHNRLGLLTSRPDSELGQLQNPVDAKQSSTCSTRASTRLTYRTPPPCPATVSMLASPIADQPSSDMNYTVDPRCECKSDAAMPAGMIEGQSTRYDVTSALFPILSAPQVTNDEVKTSRTPNFENSKKLAPLLNLPEVAVDEPVAGVTLITSTGSTMGSPQIEQFDTRELQVTQERVSEVGKERSQGVKSESSASVVTNSSEVVAPEFASKSVTSKESTAPGATSTSKVVAPEMARKPETGMHVRRAKFSALEVTAITSGDAQVSEGAAPHPKVCREPFQEDLQVASGRDSPDSPKDRLDSPKTPKVRPTRCMRPKDGLMDLSDAQMSARDLTAILETRETTRMSQIEDPAAIFHEMEVDIRSRRVLRDNAPNPAEEASLLIQDFWNDMIKKRIDRDRHVFKNVFRPRSPFDPPPVLRTRDKSVLLPSSMPSTPSQAVHHRPFVGAGGKDASDINSGEAFRKDAAIDKCMAGTTARGVVSPTLLSPSYSPPSSPLVFKGRRPQS